MHLPFVYDAIVLPTPRHKIPQQAILRGYTYAVVPEATLSDLTPVAEIPYRNSTVALFSYRGRLVRQALSRTTGSPLTALELELTLSEHFSRWPVLDGQREMDFENSLFPIARGRSQFAWAWEDGVGPMSRNTLFYESSHRGWMKPVVMDSTEDRERGWAQEEYGVSVVMVDGQPFVACPEPIWLMRTWPGPATLSSSTTPEPFHAYHAFRLDERDLAEAWCIECGLPAPFDPPDIDLLNAGLLTRDTVAELAIATIGSLRRLHLLDFGRNPECEGEKLLSRLADTQRSLDLWEMPLLLDTVSDIYDGAVEEGEFGEGLGDWGNIAKIVARWRFEIAHRRDLARYVQLSEDDLAALEDLPTW